MKILLSNAAKLTLLIISLASFAACGQKGPLEIEQPPAKTQLEELEETK